VRISTRIQRTTDAFNFYHRHVEDVFGAEVDFAQLIKLYGRGGASSTTLKNHAPRALGIDRPQRLGITICSLNRSRQNSTQREFRKSGRRWRILGELIWRRAQNSQITTAPISKFGRASLCPGESASTVAPSKAARGGSLFEWVLTVGLVKAALSATVGYVHC